MKLPLGPADARRLANMNDAELQAFLRKCGPRGVLALDAAFDLWAARGQIPPTSEGWRVWLMLAGRGFGKTRAGADWIHGLAQGPAKRIALVAASIDEARKQFAQRFVEYGKAVERPDESPTASGDACPGVGMARPGTIRAIADDIAIADRRAGGRRV